MKSIIIHPLVCLIALIGCAVQPQTNTIQEAHYTSKPKILIVLSASDHVTTREGTTHKTGYFLSELAGPAIALKQAGYELAFATPNGKHPTMDPISNDQKWFKNSEDLTDALRFVHSESSLKHPLSLESLNDKQLDAFAGVVVPGGHAPLEDLSRNAAVGQVLKYFHNTHKPTGLICHGPAALLSAPTDSNGWLYKGYRMTAFSTAEEQQEENAGRLDGHMPFYLDAQLVKFGATIQNASPWQSNAVRDRELITGQNPMSEEQFTALLLEALR